jgi:hypothetical protein
MNSEIFGNKPSKIYNGFGVNYLRNCWPLSNSGWTPLSPLLEYPWMLCHPEGRKTL